MQTCKGCSKRHPGCHDHCEDYQEATVDWIERKKWLHTCNLQTSRRWIKGAFGYKKIKG